MSADNQSIEQRLETTSGDGRLDSVEKKALQNKQEELRDDIINNREEKILIDRESHFRKFCNNNNWKVIYDILNITDQSSNKEKFTALTNFQKAKGLVVDGLIGPQTYAEILNVSGNSDLEVTEETPSNATTTTIENIPDDWEDRFDNFVARHNKTLIYSTLWIDDTADRSTKHYALTKFQENNNLTIDGIIGEKTYGKMLSLRGNNVATTAPSQPEAPIATTPQESPKPKVRIDATEQWAFERGKEIMNYLSNRTYTIPWPKGEEMQFTVNPMIAAAIIGNMYQESRCRSDISNKSSGAFGLCQWLGPRKRDLQARAREQWRDINDMQCQADFIFNERGISHHWWTDSRRTAKALQSCTTVEQATQTFRKVYERCWRNERNDTRRISTAQKLYNQSSTTA